MTYKELAVLNLNYIPLKVITWLHKRGWEFRIHNGRITEYILNRPIKNRAAFEDKR